LLQLFTAKDASGGETSNGEKLTQAKDLLAVRAARAVAEMASES
jgi:hypothetical protein